MSYEIAKTRADQREWVEPMVTVRFVEPVERAIARCGHMASYLIGVLQDDEHTEQVWLVRVDDEGLPIGRTRCYGGADTDGRTYARTLLLAMLSTKDGRFVVVHYGRGEDASRELSARVVHKAIGSIAALSRIDVVDAIIATNIDGDVSFRSLVERAD